MKSGDPGKVHFAFNTRFLSLTWFFSGSDGIAGLCEDSVPVGESPSALRSKYQLDLVWRWIKLPHLMLWFCLTSEPETGRADWDRVALKQLAPVVDFHSVHRMLIQRFVRLISDQSPFLIVYTVSEGKHEVNVMGRKSLWMKNFHGYTGSCPSSCCGWKGDWNNTIFDWPRKDRAWSK